MEPPSNASLAPNLGVAFKMDFEADFIKLVEKLVNQVVSYQLL